MSYFTGKLKDLAILIEKSFGGGSFRRIERVDNNKNTVIYYLEDLKRRRRKILKDIKLNKTKDERGV